ncbi:hypothetical protein BD408DRAFT_419831 [Parasitella parasitica]|nr:hypothetical protein BD408DRAFT_419831 [Parasitella parasitica]
MTGRKRSREEAEDDSNGLSSFQLVDGLNNIWNNGSSESYNGLIDEYHDLTTVYRRPVARKRKEDDRKSIHTAKIFKNLQEVAAQEQARVDDTKFKLPTFDQHPMIANGHTITSMLQHRYRQFSSVGSPTGIKSLPKDLRKYYLFWAMQEDEMMNGPVDRDDAMTVVGRSCWTPAEKRRFFMAVERCSRGDVAEISRRLGPTKTVAEVGAYLNLLDGAAKAIGGNVSDESYSAREMSSVFLMQESRMAAILEARLETETYAKHQELMNQEVAQKALGLFEIWNFSSLARIFGGINDMTVLSSALVQYYELLKRFIKDILTGAYTELLDSPDKTVSRSMMNHIIAKRKLTWKNLHNEKDVRLRDMDIMSMLNRESRLRKTFSEYRSASFLAKKRRMAWQNSIDKEELKGKETEEEERIIGSDSDHDSSDDQDEGSSSDDDMLKPFDKQDELEGQYIVQDDRKQHLFDDAFFQSHSRIDALDEEDDDDQDQNQNLEEDDEIVEERMQLLDETYERKLLEHLEFHNNDFILSHTQKK